MRILHVIDSAGLYGAEKIVLSLMEFQVKAHQQPALLSLGNKGVGAKSIETEAQNRGLEVLRVRFRNGYNLGGVRQIERLAEGLGSQLIHSHGYKPDILFGFLPKRNRKIPVVATLHGWTATSSLSKMGLYRLLDAIAMRRLDRVISVSSANLGSKVFKVLGVRPAVVRNGIPRLKFDNECFERAFPEIASVCKERFSIISVGRLSREKGYSVLLEAIGELVKDGADVFLVVFGEGPEKPRLQELAKAKGISERVILLGYQNEAFHFMPFFDVFALPSLTEGLPVTMLEAMQAAIPIVATRVGEVPELLNDGTLGELANPGDPKSLAIAIRSVLKDKDRARRRALLALTRVIEKYSVEAMGQAYLAHYSEVLAGRRKSL